MRGDAVQCFLYAIRRLFAKSARRAFGPTMLFVCALAVLVHPAQAQPAQGDVNADGVLNLLDYGLIREHLLERAPLTGELLSRADADRDGALRVADVLYVAKRAVIPPELTILLPGNLPFTLVRIPRGNFMMGPAPGERNSFTREEPAHLVTIDYDFYMGKYELTQAQWLALMGKWPDPVWFPDTRYGVGDDVAAYFISWYDCQDFLAALNAHVTATGQGSATFRMPSEAEWEYACRAGTTTRFYFGDSLSVDDYATDGPAGNWPGYRSTYMWYLGSNLPYGMKPVGTKVPNLFGLYDMHGNVWEWCRDLYHEGYAGAPADGSAWESPAGVNRLIRGGNWIHWAVGNRSAFRYHLAFPELRSALGLRVVRKP
jgi:formylglycine-generating enzyme required for sulfatase activity